MLRKSNDLHGIQGITEFGMIVDAWHVKALGAAGVNIGLRSLYAENLCAAISSVLATENE